MMYKILILVMLVFLSGCDDNAKNEYISNGDTAKTYKESELLPETRPITNNDTVILYLEKNNSHEGDTGTTGVDVVTYQFKHSVQQSVCLEEHETVDYQLVVKDEDEKIVAEITDGKCQTISISPGKYYFYLSSSSTEKSLESGSTVFIRPYAETTYCDDYKYSATVKKQKKVNTKTVNHCISGSDLVCTIPSTYEELPYECPLRGPWFYSDIYECSEMDSDQAGNCKTYLYNKCDAIESLCKNYWQDYSTNDEPYDNWGDSGIDIWTKCFSGSSNQYVYPKYSNIADPVITEAFQKFTEQFCEDVATDCSSGWKTTSSAPANCDGFVKYSKYSDLNLKSGEIAVYQRTYLHLGRNTMSPQSDDIVMVINGRCDNIPHRVGGVLVGAHTQAVAYALADLKGMPTLIENDKDEVRFFKAPTTSGRAKTASLDPYSQTLLYSIVSSVTVTSKTGSEDDLCRVKDVGLSCDTATSWDIAPELSGEVAIVKTSDATINAGTNCAAAYLFDYRCDDLNKLGLNNPEGKIEKVILPDSNTVLRTFQNKEFAGSVKISKGTSSAVSTIYLDSENFESAQVYKLPDYNHAILISLRKCCGCDLENVDFTGEDLSNTVFVGSNMDGTLFKDTNLLGADLRGSSLENSKFSSVQFGDNYLGCTDLTNVDMSDPDDSSKSTSTVTGIFNWDISSSYNGIDVSCDSSKTDLTAAKILIQILPKTTWNTINLQNATLLDKTDGYDLSGIDLSNGNYTGLRAGGKILNMKGANLSGSDLTNADFSSVDFSPLITDKKAQYSDFSNTKIGGASFANTNLEGSTFKSVTTDGISGSVDFSYSFMINVLFSDADLGRVNFSYAYLFSKFREDVTEQKKATAENIVSQDGVFTGSFMSNMTFTNVSFKNGNFNAAQMVGTTFEAGSDLSNAKFSDAYLHGADFSKATLTDASFSGAYLSLESGYWHYSSDDAECSEIRIEYEKTNLGDSSEITCPNGEKGPCDTDEKLNRKDKKTVEPPCVDGDNVDIFGNSDCITHEYLENNTIPKCDESNDDVMQCGCLVEGA